MKLNVYKRTPGKPMIYSLHSAKEFLSQTKNPIEFRLKAKEQFLIVHNNRLQIVSRSFVGDIGIDTELYTSIGEQCISDLYKLRKYINNHFTAVGG